MNIEEPVVVDLLFSRSENFVVVQPTVSLSEENGALYVRQSYVIFVLDIRTGMNDEALHRLESCLLDSCFEFITKKALGISFIVNGVHYNVKNIDRDYLKALLKSILKTTI